MGCPMIIMVYIIAMQCPVPPRQKKKKYSEENVNNSNCLEKKLLKKHHFKQRGLEEYVPIGLKSLL